MFPSKQSGSGRTWLDSLREEGEEEEVQEWTGKITDWRQTILVKLKMNVLGVI